jgi:two-component system sensor histidine kinase DesK
VTVVSSIGRAQAGSGVRARLFNGSAYRWYLGTIFGLAYQAYEVVYIWTSTGSTGYKLLATAVLTVFYLGYIVLPPLVWPEHARVRILAIAIYWAATLALLPFLGVFLIWVWILVVAMTAFCWLPAAASVVITVLIAGTQVALASTAQFGSGTLFAPFVTATVAVSLFAVTSQISANRKLRDAQAAIASLAAADERARLARDLHDVLGHSLTVVAVKSELAGRLVELDPAKAFAEIRDIEALARTALVDLRAAVTAYRDMNLDSELATARTALDAAGIRAHLPSDGSNAEEALRPLFSWVLREGVTNVIRHSRAQECWVELGAQSLVVRDDGLGVPRHRHGNGLTGLTERAVEAGARLTAANGKDGGFVLAVAKGGR